MTSTWTATRIPKILISQLTQPASTRVDSSIYKYFFASRTRVRTRARGGGEEITEIYRPLFGRCVSLHFYRERRSQWAAVSVCSRRRRGGSSSERNWAVESKKIALIFRTHTHIYTLERVINEQPSLLRTFSILPSCFTVVVARMSLFLLLSFGKRRWNYDLRNDAVRAMFIFQFAGVTVIMSHFMNCAISLPRVF